MGQFCISCGVENESQAKFCRSCGQKLDKDEYKHFNEADSSNNIKQDSKDLSLWYLLIPFFISCFSHIQNWAVKYDKEDVSIIDFALYMLSSGLPEVYGELLGAGIAPILFSLVIVGIVWLVKRVRSKTYSNVKLGLFIWSLIFSLLILASGIWNNEEKTLKDEQLGGYTNQKVTEIHEKSKEIKSENRPISHKSMMKESDSIKETEVLYPFATFSLFSLNIKTNPPNANVYIMNIKPKYYDGILLEKGIYNIKIKKNGYKTKIISVTLDKNMVKEIYLDKDSYTEKINKTTEKINKFIEYKEETIVHNGNTYRTVQSPYTKKIWLDRNLGASRVCKSHDDESCYGDYFQWGRDADGHEKQNSATSPFLASSDTPSNGKMIIVVGPPANWSIKTNENLWQGENGKNNPCPKGFRVPTIDELEAETIHITNNRVAYESFLKLPSAGYRNYSSGVINKQGSWGSLWSSSFYGWQAYRFNYSPNYNDRELHYLANSLSVRCIQD